MTYYLSASTRKDKKFMIETPNGKIIHFGAYGYADYTIHRDDERKERYIKRHERREDWDNPETAGFWSYWLLWNKPTIQKSIVDVEYLFNINIVMD